MGPLHDARHHARLKVRIGRRSIVRAELAIDTSGLLAIGAMVTSILLSTAAIVRVARASPGPRHEPDVSSSR